MGYSLTDVLSLGNDPFYFIKVAVCGRQRYLFDLFLRYLFGNTLKLIIFVFCNLKK